jgi:hypothetical protein
VIFQAHVKNSDALAVFKRAYIGLSFASARGFAPPWLLTFSYFLLWKKYFPK